MERQSSLIAQSCRWSAWCEAALRQVCKEKRDSRLKQFPSEPIMTGNAGIYFEPDVLPDVSPEADIRLEDAAGRELKDQAIDITTGEQLTPHGQSFL